MAASAGFQGATLDNELLKTPMVSAPAKVPNPAYKPDPVAAMKLGGEWGSAPELENPQTLISAQMPAATAFANNQQTLANQGQQSISGLQQQYAAPQAPTMQQTVKAAGAARGPADATMQVVPQVGDPVATNEVLRRGQIDMREPALNPLAAGGGGAAEIAAVDQALIGYDAAAPQFGRGVMGTTPAAVQMGALPGATERGMQISALDRALGFDPRTASQAQAQLADATNRNLANSLALARSARGGPAAVAAALRRAQGEQAATMSQAARDLALLRAKEEDTAKGRELEALGLGGELAGAIRSADVGERGQNIGALEAALTAGTTQRGQTIEQAIAARNAGVQERGQDVQAAASAQQRELDAILGRSQLAQTTRNAAVTERGQTLDAQMRGEAIKQAYAAVAASAATEAEKIRAEEAIRMAELGYELTPQQKILIANIQAQATKEANDPSLLQEIFGGIQAVGTGIGAVV